MKAFNEIIVGTITRYSGTDTPDKNGEEAIMIQCMAGKMPNRNVLSGTVALRTGLEIGKTYLINIRENGTDEQFGRDFTWTKVQEITSPLEIVKAIKELGDPEVITIPRPDGYEKTYERKTNVIEGLRTKRIKEGFYKPVTNRSYEHETANEVREGSSAESDTKRGGADKEELFPHKKKQNAEQLNN